MPGFLLIDKPPHITSHDVVDRVRHITGEKRVGHAGTLDPFATGLLIVGVGREATREFSKLVGLDKMYEAIFLLGASSDTDDCTGKITVTNPLILPLEESKTSREKMKTALKQFIGEISQIPPTYSAIKIRGKKMYEAAREGKPLEAKPRTVTVHSIELLAFPIPSLLSTLYSLTLRIHCSSGTYIRAIARDLGVSLGIGGYVQELRRTAIGSFSINDSVKLSTFTQENWQSHLIPISEMLLETSAKPLPTSPSAFA